MIAHASGPAVRDDHGLWGEAADRPVVGRIILECVWHKTNRARGTERRTPKKNDEQKCVTLHGLEPSELKLRFARLLEPRVATFAIPYYMALMILAAAHKLEEGALPLRVFFGICLVAVFFAGIHVFRRRREWFDRDPEVTADTWASRNLRLWQVILVWVLAMELLITMLFRL
jgi:hypothetical protein